MQYLKTRKLGAIGKRGYLTVVMDIHSDAVVFVGNGKGSDSLEPFWQRLQQFQNMKTEAVAIDMSPAYIKTIRENLKTSVIVFDHFRVIKLFNEKLSNFKLKIMVLHKIKYALSDEPHYPLTVSFRYQFTFISNFFVPG